uniref:Vacuolar ATPase assembly integral membrane protein VMA21 homolog n=2 Tax=Endopterygota TaxID=33392 RepID=A0A034WMS7_BACDO
MKKGKLNMLGDLKDTYPLVKHHEGSEDNAVEDGQIKDVAFSNDTSALVYLWLIIFSILMFTFPFITFYGVRSWLHESFDISEFYINCWAVLSSVLVVNVIICLYVFKAISEENNCDSVMEKQNKKDI